MRIKRNKIKTNHYDDNEEHRTINNRNFAVNRKLYHIPWPKHDLNIIKQRRKSPFRMDILKSLKLIRFLRFRAAFW